MPMTPKQAIRNGLREIADDLRKLPMTKNDILGIATLPLLTDCLRCAYDDPRPYTVSSLVQVIDQFLVDHEHDN